MREVRKKKRYKRSLLLRLSVVCLAVYILAALIDQQIQISEKAGTTGTITARNPDSGDPERRSERHPVLVRRDER